MQKQIIVIRKISSSFKSEFYVAQVNDAITDAHRSHAEISELETVQFHTGKEKITFKAEKYRVVKIKVTIFRPI